MTNFYGEESTLGNQEPTIHVHRPGMQSLYDAPAVSGSIAKWVSHPFPWQQLIYRDIFSIDDKGKLTTRVVCVSIPRRNGKTEIIVASMIVFAIMFSANVLYTGSDAKLAKLTYKRLIEAATDPDSTLKNFFPKLELKDKAHEHVVQAVDPRTGKKLGTLSFATRKGDGGRGGTYDVVVIDEAQDLTVDQYARYGPTNAATKKHDRGKKRNPISLTILFGTPPTLTKEHNSNATIFRGVRDNMISQKDLPWEMRSKKGTVWIEWGSDVVCDPRDREAWRRFNPSMGYLGGMEEYFEDSILPPEEFSVEHLGYWTKQSKDRAINIEDFNRLAIPKDEAVQGIKDENCKMAVAIKSDPRESVVHLGIAWRRADGKIFYDQLRTFYPDQPGWAEQLGAMAVNLAKNPKTVRVSIDGALATSAVTSALIKARLWSTTKSRVLQGKILMVTPADIVKASASLTVAISTRKLQHCGSAPLHRAVEDAKKRPIGETGYGFASISGTVDILPVEVCALAIQGVETKAQNSSRSTPSDSSAVDPISRIF